jgi:hypothetical protein
LALLKNCENVVALLHYNNQAAAAVDYIMLNFDNIFISNFVWTGFIKESSHVCSKKVKFFILEPTQKINIFVTKNLYLFSWLENKCKLVIILNKLVFLNG